MNIDEFREYCLSMPGTSDKMPWKQKQYENLLVFSIGDKWFCFVDIEKFKFCDLKCNPEKSSELQASYSGIKPGWHMNHRNWISVYFNSDVPDNLIRQLVKESYENVFDSLTKKKRGNIEIEE